MPTAPAMLRFALMLVMACALTSIANSIRAQVPGTSPRGTASIYAKLLQAGDLKLRNTPVSEALAAVAKIWKVNISSSAELQGVVTSTHDGSTLGEVLQAILLPNGYSYQIIGNTIVVVASDEVGLQNPLFRNETIPLRYTAAVELAQAAKHLVSPQGQVDAIESANALLVIDFPERIAEIKKFAAQMEEVNRKRRPTSGLNANQIDVAHVDLQYVKAETIVKTVEAALGKDGRVAIDLSENRLVIKDTVANLAIVEKLIENLDIPRPQVRITALIYDVGLRDLEECGINWNSALKFDFNGDGSPNQLIDLDSVQRIPFMGTPIDSALTIQSLNTNFDLTSVISALSEAEDSRLLADPMISVLNNEEALFQSVEEIPYQELTETSAGGNIGTTSFKEVGIKLRVTPQIAADGTVQLTVNPVFSRLAGFTPNTDQPIIDRRETNTRVRVRDGQTFVLGGMRRRTENHFYTGVPYLMNIQFLHIGKLFRSRKNEVRESELIVFIKTDIVTPVTKKLPREEMADHAGAEMLNQVPSAIDIWPVGPFGHSIEEYNGVVEPLLEQPEAEPILPPNDARRRAAPTTGDESDASAIAARQPRWQLPPQRQRSPDSYVVTRLPVVSVPVYEPKKGADSTPSREQMLAANAPAPKPNLWLAQTIARRSGSRR
ncbi:MAG: hypothetical protein MI757_06565 [Pirellulales bacterium]|nr:hypothetical protein [Pirellulales bacterium]